MKGIVLADTQIGSQEPEGVTSLKQYGVNVVGSKFALVIIDQDGPASYPDKPNTLVTNN